MSDLENNQPEVEITTTEEAEPVTTQTFEVPPPEVETEHESTPVAVPLTPKPNITIRGPVTKSTFFKEGTNFVSLLNMSLKELEDNAESFDEKVAAGAAKESWLQAINEAVGMFYGDDAFNSTINRPESDFRQGVEHNGRYITGGAPQIGAKPGSLLTGEGALLRVRALSGYGSIVQIPLWHSGIWVKIKAPADNDLLELNRSLAFNKTEFGRSTVGSIFSNESVYMNTIIARFVLKYVYTSSLADNSVVNLMNTIRATDIPTLVWGLSCAIFSNGYPLSRPCINNPRDCQHVEKALLNINKMCFTDGSALTDWQKEYMLNAEQIHKPEDILKYQAVMIEKQNGTTVDFNADVKIHLGIPSIAEYEASGSRWIDSIVQMTETAATKALEGNVREQYINDQAKLTRLRQYGHWISEISLSSDERITDIQTIEEILTSLSSNESWDDGEDAPDSLLSKISKFVENVTVSVIGIPRYECTQCGAEQTDEYNKHPELIIIDVVKFFFTLVSQRLVSNISRRP